MVNNISAQESLEITDEVIEVLYKISEGKISRAIDLMQLSSISGKKIDLEKLYEFSQKFRNDLIRSLLMVGINKSVDGEVFNIGGRPPIDFITLAKKIVEIAGTGRYEFSDFTKERKELEHGDYYSDYSKIGRLIGWEPQVSLEEGISKTVEFYRKFKKYYW